MKAQALRDSSLTSCMVPKKTMKLNPKHSFTSQLRKKAEGDTSAKTLNDLIWLLFDTASLTSGFNLEEPIGIVMDSGDGVSVCPSTLPEAKHQFNQRRSHLYSVAFEMNVTSVQVQAAKQEIEESAKMVNDLICLLFETAPLTSGLNLE